MQIPKNYNIKISDLIKINKRLMNLIIYTINKEKFKQLYINYFK